MSALRLHSARYRSKAANACLLRSPAAVCSCSWGSGIACCCPCGQSPASSAPALHGHAKRMEAIGTPRAHCRSCLSQSVAAAQSAQRAPGRSWPGDPRADWDAVLEQRGPGSPLMPPRGAPARRACCASTTSARCWSRAATSPCTPSAPTACTAAQVGLQHPPCTGFHVLMLCSVSCHFPLMSSHPPSHMNRIDTHSTSPQQQSGSPFLVA